MADNEQASLRQPKLSDVLSSETEFVEASTLPTPGPIGRLVRLVFGLGILLAIAPGLIQGYSFFRGSITAPESFSFWTITVFGLVNINHVVNLGLGKSWGRRPQMGALAGTAVTLILDLFFYGTWWAPPLGMFTWAWLTLMYLPLGIAFLLAAILGTPGCEMRSFNHLVARLQGHDPTGHFCPGGVDFADCWGAKND